MRKYLASIRSCISIAKEQILASALTPTRLRNFKPHSQLTLDPLLLTGDPGYPQHLAPLSQIDSNLPLPSPLVPPKTPPKPSTSDYISSSSWIEPPQPQPQTKMTRSRSPSTSSSSSSSSEGSTDLYETDSEADHEAQLQFEESVRQLQSLVNLVIVPWVSRYFGRKWSYYRELLSSLTQVHGD